jgi:hypothetical protein
MIFQCANILIMVDSMQTDSASLNSNIDAKNATLIGFNQFYILLNIDRPSQSASRVITCIALL